MFVAEASSTQLAFTRLPAGIVILDGQGRVQDANPKAIEFLDEPLVGEIWIRVIERAFIRRQDDGCEVSLKSGRRLSVLTQSLQDQPGQVILLHDLTQTRAHLDHSNRQQRLAAMGEMAAQMAHQIRTPLATALLYAANLATEALDRETQEDFNKKLIERLNHIEQLIKDMLLFAKGGSGVIETIVISDLTEAIDRIMDYDLSRHNVEFCIENLAGTCRLKGNTQALKGALQNLIENAQQAAGGPLKITLKTAQCVPSYVDIVIEDNGPGMSEQLMAQITEPFFTTRSDGCGLGLAVVQGVAKSHGGELILGSREGQGSRIGLRLPTIESTE